MKVAIVLAAVIAVACANAVGRAGWGSGSHKPTIDLEMAGAAAATGAGNAGGAQALLEHAIGTVDFPAYISSISGLDASVSQGEEVSQLAVADKPSGATSTIQGVDVNNQASSVDVLAAAVGGSILATVDNAAATGADGQGAIAAEGNSYNNSEQ